MLRISTVASAVSSEHAWLAAWKSVQHSRVFRFTLQQATQTHSHLLHLACPQRPSLSPNLSGAVAGYLEADEVLEPTPDWQDFHPTHTLPKLEVGGCTGGLV